MTRFLSRILVLIAVLVGTAVGASAQVTATGHILNPDGTPAKSAKACFSLQNFKPQSPRVLASGTIVQTSTFCVPTSPSDGSFTTTLYPNYAIAPAQTFWRVDYMIGGIQQSSATYNISTNPFNLDSAAPTTTFPPPNGFVNGAHQFDFAQASPATTWTIHHAFGSKSVVFNCYDINNKFLIPDTVVETDLNTLTITFTSPQAGSCVVMSAGNSGAITTAANAVVTNPNTTQVINGAPLTLQAPLTALDANHLNAYNINNIITVDGVKYTTMNAAFADPVCAAGTGCTIDMRGNSNAAALNLGSFDPGAKAVTVLLGPFTYSVNQITIRGGLHFYGSVSSPSPNGAVGTIIQSSSTTTTPFVLTSADPILGVDIGHFRLYCGAGNTTQIGMNINPAANGGLWYSSMEDIFVGGDAVHECGGGGMILNGDAGGSPEAINQFLHFSDIYIFRKSGGAPALKLFGLNAQIQFDHCQFDGPEPHDSNMVNVLIDSGTQSLLAANTIVFHDTTFQHAWGSSGVAVQIRGCSDCVIDTGHFEDDNGGIKTTIGDHFGTFGTVVRNSLFTTNTGVNLGTGFITSTDAFSSLSFDNNAVYGTVDTMHAGNTTYLSHQGTFNAFGGIPYPSPISSFRPIVGYDPDGPAFKHVRASTGSLAPGRSSVNVAWTTPFADIAYTFGCMALDTGNAATSAGLVVERANAIQTTNGITVTVNNLGSTVSGFLQCWAWHD